MARYVEISDVETSYGAGGSGFAGIRVKSVSNPVDRGLLVEENIEGYIPTAAYGGALKLSGTIEGNLRPQQMENLFYSLFGTDTAGTLSLSNPTSIGMRIGENTVNGSTDIELEYVGVTVKTANITLTAKEFVTVRFDWFAKNYSSNAFDTGVTYTDEEPVVFYAASVRLGGTYVQDMMKSMTINIDRKVDEERFVIGDYTVQEIGINGMNEITGDITFTEHQYGEFRRAMFGATDGTALDCKNDVGSLAATVYFHSRDPCAVPVMTLTMGTIVYGSTDTTINGQNEIEKKVNYRAVGSNISLVIAQ